VALYSLLVKLGSLALNKAYRVHRTGGQAVAESVAEILAKQLRLAADYADSGFLAGVGAESAAVALFFIYMYYSSYHMVTSVFLLISFVSA
jgi:hypothetical protein